MSCLRNGFCRDQSPLGHHVGGMFKNEEMVIVGVVKDNKYTSMTGEPIPMIWYDYAQAPMAGAMHLEMRVQGDPRRFCRRCRRLWRRWIRMYR